MNRLANLLLRTWSGGGALTALAALPFLIAPGAITRLVSNEPALPAILAPPASPLVIYAGVALAAVSMVMFITQWMVDERRIWLAVAALLLVVAALAPVVHG